MATIWRPKKRWQRSGDRRNDGNDLATDDKLRNLRSNPIFQLLVAELRRPPAPAP
jgi:hypothetical protein